MDKLNQIGLKGWLKIMLAMFLTFGVGLPVIEMISSGDVSVKKFLSILGIAAFGILILGLVAAISYFAIRGSITTARNMPIVAQRLGLNHKPAASLPQLNPGIIEGVRDGRQVTVATHGMSVNRNEQPLRVDVALRTPLVFDFLIESSRWVDDGLSLRKLSSRPSNPEFSALRFDSDNPQRLKALLQQGEVAERLGVLLKESDNRVLISPSQVSSLHEPSVGADGLEAQIEAVTQVVRALEA